MAQQADDEDAWDLADEDAENSSSLELNREWSSRHSHFHTLGYRDGIEEGKKSSVQQGFDTGYSQGIVAGRNCGLARGWAGAFVALSQPIQSLLLDDDTVRTHIDEAQAALSSLSSEKAAYLFYNTINRPEGNCTSPVSEDLILNDTTSHDASFSVEKFHSKLQTVLQSKGILQ